MTKTVHFEIFIRRGSKGGWTLLEASSLPRNETIDRAKAELGQKGVVAIKVTKETYDEEDGTFGSVTIFEDGQQEVKAKAKREVPKLPCFKPQDLFSHHARSVIGRVLKSTLEEWQLIPMELIHRADMLEKLEARSTILQGAVQQVAVAQSADAPGTLHEVFRQLMDLALKSMDMVMADERKGRLKALAKDSIAAFWTGREVNADSSYHLAAAVAKHLKGAEGWTSKIRSVLELMSDLPSEDEKRKVSFETIDSFVAEMVRSSASVVDLLGPREDLGAALYSLASLFLGKDDAAGRPPYLDPLAKAMTSGALDRTRGALAERILAEIRSPTRFHPDSFERELETMRRLAQQLVLGVCPHLSLDAVTDAFASRSKRLVSPEQIEAYLETAPDPDVRLARLIDLAENVVGTYAKRVVAGYIRMQLASPKTETHFTLEGGPTLARLKRIAELQTEAAKRSFDAGDRADILKAFDTLGVRVAERAHFFRSIEQREGTSADKALGLLRLVEKRMLPQGECDTRAKNLATAYMKRPDFGATLFPDGQSPKDRQARGDELRTLMEATGLKPKEEPAPVVAAAETAA